MKREQKIESILNSLDGLEKANPRPFFFTRLEARMQEEVKGSFVEKILGFLIRPSVAIAAVVLIVVVNAFVIISTTLHSEDQATEGNKIEIATVDQYLQMSANPFDGEKVNP